MKSKLIPLLFIVCCIGCTGSSQRRNTEGSETSGPSLVADESIDDAVSRIQIGLSESELMDALKPISVSTGTVYWGGSGARRVYFQLNPQEQIWFEVAGPSDGNNITAIGPIEPKTKWTHHDGDSITVEPQNAGKQMLDRSPRRSVSKWKPCRRGLGQHGRYVLETEGMSQWALIPSNS